MASEDKVNLPQQSSNFCVGDLAGLGQIATAIIQQVSRGIGSLYKPRSLRKEIEAKADAEAYALIKRAQAESCADVIRQTMTRNLLERTSDRVRVREIERQLNIEDTVEEALKLVDEQSTSDTPRNVSYDWMSRFLDYVQNVSDKEVQRIWSVILARQFVNDQRPISLLTLDSLRLMEYEHALSFEKLYKICSTYGSYLIPSIKFQSYLEWDFLRPLEALGFAKQSEFNENVFPFQSGYSLVWEWIDNDQEYIMESIPQYKLTFQGDELSQVLFS
ncbi:MAG: DUF2806 domain-containing protein, partial [Cytophagales bacterium]|nr:DUF2806 domain-containing protein [Cytophagales bacterium]